MRITNIISKLFSFTTGKASLLALPFFMASSAFSQVDVVYSDLVWSDEFDYQGPVNPDKWHHQTQIPAGGSWYNNEVQHYTNRLANSFVSGTDLNIIAKRENFTDQNVSKQFTSARLNSKFAFRYGRVDIRAKASNDPGTWPALWLLGKNINEDGAFFDSQFGTTSWPACGELDIMEHGIFTTHPINYIGSAIHTPSSSGNTVNKGGIQAADIAQNYHIYSMNWSPNQITFLLDGVAFYTYNPSVKNPETWPFDKDHFLIFNIALGGYAGNVPPAFNEANMVIDYVRVYQNVLSDTQPPTNFTATVGAISESSVELKLNALDNSGLVKYSIYYGSNSSTVTGLSGIEKSATISGLFPNSNYTFSVSATDTAGNPAENNPIELNATTLENLACEGTDIVASQGTFTDGYKYKFETFGTDVKFTFELLDNKPDLIAYLWRQNPFSEVQMTNIGGRKFSHTLSGQTLGATINYAAKFAFAGGMSVTRYIPYVVGTDCATNVVLPEHSEVSIFPNPTDGKIYFTGLENKTYEFSLMDLTGKSLKTGILPSKATFLDVSQFKKGVYILNLKSGNSQISRKLEFSK
jgi:beta-glucanase (GH16 family)